MERILDFVAAILDLDVDWDRDYEDDVFVVDRQMKRANARRGHIRVLETPMPGKTA